jgi:hypothetical protein
MMDNCQSKACCKIEATSPIIPEDTRDSGGKKVAKKNDDGEIISMLPLNDRICSEIRNISCSTAKMGLKYHPANVSPQEPPVGIVRIEVSVSVAMMCPMHPSPPITGTLHGTRASENQHDLERHRCIVGAVRPQTMVA